MPTALSTWCRTASIGPADWCAEIAALGAQAVALDTTCPPDFTAALARELAARRESLPTIAVEAPCPALRGARPPYLAALERDERKAAQDATRDTIRLASSLGAGVVIVRLGRLAVRHEWQHTVRAFARRTLETSDVEEILAARTKLSGRAVDAARFGLDPVLDAAGAAGVTIALVNGARWFELPDPIELNVLVADFSGAPLAAWHDAAAAAHAREATGFGRVADALAMTGSRLAGAWLTDAAGLRGGLPWGRGEVDRAAVIAALPEHALRVVHCAPGATTGELAAALAT